MSQRILASLLIASSSICAVVFGAAPGSAVASTAKTVASQLVLDNDGTAVATYAAPCTTKGGCDNGLRLLWTSGPCYDQRTYPPIAVGWFYQNIPSPKYWPIASPCGTGITLQWSPGGTLSPPNWVKAPIKNQDLVRFPSHANRATVYANGGHNPTTAEWLLNGKVKATITLPSADDVTWNSYMPAGGAAVHRARVATVPPPTVKLWGRKGSFTDQTATATAPANADGVQFAWYLSLSDKNAGRGRGCRLVNGTYWTDPPVMFEYVDHGALEGRLNTLTCPTPGGSPEDFNMINFNWALSGDGSEYVLNSAVATFNNGLPLTGVVPQPPTGTDGLYFESDLDDFQSANWLHGGSYVGKALSHPQHVRFQVWSGK